MFLFSLPGLVAMHNSNVISSSDCMFCSVSVFYCVLVHRRRQEQKNREWLNKSGLRTIDSLDTDHEDVG